MITRLCTSLLSFPHSTAEVERIFSQVSLIKNQKRGNLSKETLEGLILYKYQQLNLMDPEIFDSVIEKEQAVMKNLSIAAIQSKLKRNSISSSTCIVEPGSNVNTSPVVNQLKKTKQNSEEKSSSKIVHFELDSEEFISEL